MQNTNSDSDKPTQVLLMSMPDTIIGFNLAARLPNLGLVSIASNRNPKESTIYVLDLVLCRHALKRSIFKALNKVKPEIVGLSCMIFQYKTAQNILKEYRDELNAVAEALIEKENLTKEKLILNLVDEAGGIYILRVTVGNNSVTKKITLVK